MKIRIRPRHTARRVMRRTRPRRRMRRLKGYIKRKSRPHIQPVRKKIYLR